MHAWARHRQRQLLRQVAEADRQLEALLRSPHLEMLEGRLFEPKVIPKPSSLPTPGKPKNKESTDV